MFLIDRGLKIGHIWVLFLIIALVNVGCQALASSYEFKGSLRQPPLILPDFELRDTNRQPFHLKDVEGDITLVYFGYTACPDICPLTMWDVKKALDELEAVDQSRVHVLFVTIDPERDTPEALSRYMASFGPQFIGLTDDIPKVADVMRQFGASAEKEEVADSAVGYLFSHSTNLYLVDPQGNLILRYPFGFVAENLRSDLAYLLQ